MFGPLLFAHFLGSFPFSQLYLNFECVKYSHDVTLNESLSLIDFRAIALDPCVSLFSREGLFCAPC